MRHYLTICALISTMLVALAAPAHATISERRHMDEFFGVEKETPRKRQTDEERVRQVLNTWVTAVNNRQVDVLTRLYTKDAVLQTALCPKAHNTAEMRQQFFRKLLEKKSLRVSLTEANVRIMKDVAIVDGRYTFTYSKKKSVKKVAERFSQVLVRTKDGWMITDHHISKVPGYKKHRKHHKHH